MTDEDRAVAAEAGDGPSRSARDGSPFRLRLVAHDPEAYDRYYNVVANPTLWFLQHSLWGLATEPDVDRAARRLAGRLRGGERRLRGRGVRRARPRDPDAAGLLPRLPPLSRAPARAGAAPGRDALALRPHPVAGARRLARAAGPDQRARCTRGSSRTTSSGFHTARWREQLPPVLRRLLGPMSTARPATCRLGGRTCLTRVHPASVDPASSTRSPRATRCSRPRTRSSPSGPSSSSCASTARIPSKNVVRGFRAFARFLELHPELHGRVRMLALLDPSRQDIPAYAEYLAAIEREARRSTTASAGGWIRSTCGSRTTSPRRSPPTSSTTSCS